jgi:hypothetical protein
VAGRASSDPRGAEPVLMQALLLAVKIKTKIGNPLRNLLNSWKLYQPLLHKRFTRSRFKIFFEFEGQILVCENNMSN